MSRRYTHPTNQRGTSPNRPFQNGGGGAPRKATPAQNGPTHPRTQRNFSVCLKQIAAIKIANAMAAEYSRAQEISPICQPALHRQLQGILLMCAAALGADFSGYALGPSPQEATGRYKGSHRTIR